MTECRLSRVSHGTTNESNWAFQFTKSSWWAWKTRLLRMAALVALSPKSRKSGFATRTCVCVCERQRVHRAHARIHCEALAQLILIGRHWRSQHIRNGRNWLRGIARATRCHGKFKESRSCLSFGFSLTQMCLCVCVYVPMMERSDERNEHPNEVMLGACVRMSTVVRRMNASWTQRAQYALCILCCAATDAVGTSFFSSLLWNDFHSIQFFVFAETQQRAHTMLHSSVGKNLKMFHSNNSISI